LSDTAQNSPVFADLAQIFEPIRDDLEAVEQEFVRHIQSRVALIPEMGRYIQKSGGKRVRPAVLLMASRLTGYRGDRAVLYASVVEFIQTAPICAAAVWPCTRAGATTSPCSWATTCTSSRWRWR
jgi:hypothetical protein